MRQGAVRFGAAVLGWVGLGGLGLIWRGSGGAAWQRGSGRVGFGKFRRVAVRWGWAV